METKKTEILRVLIGSRAHGLENKNSDWDYRHVFVTETSELLKVGAKVKQADWKETDGVDSTGWELGHFLDLARHCNPTILECFLAPRTDEKTPDVEIGADRTNQWGTELRALFPYVWNSKGVLDAFCGYSHNQRKKMLDNKDNRAAKYAVAYGRTLWQAYELLTTGTFTVRIADTEYGTMFKKWKAGNFTYGEVIDWCGKMQKELDEVYCAQVATDKTHETDMDKVNQYLLKVRREFWV